MNRYLLFAGENVHPHGGWRDFIKGSNSLRALIEIATEEVSLICHGHQVEGVAYDWFHVYDCEAGRLAAESYYAGDYAVENGESVVYENNDRGWRIVRDEEKNSQEDIEGQTWELFR